MLAEQRRDELVAAGLGVLQARTWAEYHPEDPHAGDQLDLASDIFDDAFVIYQIAAGLQ